MKIPGHFSPKINTPEIQRQTIVSQASKARAAKTAIAADRNAKLANAIRAASAQMKVSKNALAASKEFADRIRPNVLQNLGIPPDHKGNPSVGTIKSTISQMKKSAKA